MKCRSFPLLRVRATAKRTRGFGLDWIGLDWADLFVGMLRDSPPTFASGEQTQTSSVGLCDIQCKLPGQHEAQQQQEAHRGASEQYCMYR